MAIAVRSIARALMGGAVKRGVSARAFRRELIGSFGMAYRWTTLLSDYREFTNMARFEKGIRALRAVTRPALNLMTETELRRERRYRGIGQATYENIDTGEQYTQVISMYDDKFDSKESFTNTFIEDKKVSEYLPSEEIVSIEWFVIEHNKGWSY